MVKQYSSGICVVFWTSAAEVTVQLLSWKEIIYICVLFFLFFAEKFVIYAQTVSSSQY
jgi:hypothetical protein